MGAPTVEISKADLTLEEVLSVADGAAVALGEDAVELIGRSRAVVDAAIERGEAVYGTTTGVGHARDHRLPEEALMEVQPFLVEMHVGAVGEPLPTELVRSGMVVRLNGFARGGAGVSPEVAVTLEAMLNQRIHPIIPGHGSVGSGDLGQLALLGRAMLGRGEVEWRGRRVPAVDALRESGIAPVTLQPKDALGIISSNALTIGHGISEWREIGRLLDVADLVAAVSMEAIGANPSFFDPAVSRARHSPGQEATSRNLRAAVQASARIDPGRASVQDPISFRVVPQVHGACRDTHSGLAAELGNELNAPADNPMVDVESGRVLSNGNFHMMNVALATESMKLALAHVGMLSDRRCGQLWDKVVASLGDVAGGDPSQGPLSGEGVPPALAGLTLRYAMAARYTRLRQLAQPVTLDVPSLDLSVEDHATNAAEALWTMHEITGIVTEILAVELLLAHARLFTSPTSGGLGTRTSVLVDRVSQELDSLPPGTLPDQTHVRVMEILASVAPIVDG
jgi:histidine ammonia-lyase